MTRTTHPRLLVPGVMAIGGSTIALATLVNSGWEAALSVEAFTIVATIGYYVLGGRDSDFGAIFGGRPDERQTSAGMKATALAGIVTTVVALGGFVVATAVGSTTWPFALFCSVSAASFLAGLVIYRSGG
jgi:hypothetical protein